MIHSFTIHNNGDSAEQMKRAFLEVNKLASRLETALSDAPPNMRNYYCNGDGPTDFKRDVESFRRILMQVKNIQDWSMGGVIHVLQQENK